MKALLTTTGIAVAILAGALLWLGVPAFSTEEVQTTTAVFKVDGMTCGGCEVALRTAIGKLDGVERVKASHKEGRAAVTYNQEKVTPEQILAAIDKLGYKAEQEQPGRSE